MRQVWFSFTMKDVLEALILWPCSYICLSPFLAAVEEASVHATVLFYLQNVIFLYWCYFSPVYISQMVVSTFFSVEEVLLVLILFNYAAACLDSTLFFCQYISDCDFLFVDQWNRFWPASRYSVAFLLPV